MISPQQHTNDEPRQHRACDRYWLANDVLHRRALGRAHGGRTDTPPLVRERLGAQLWWPRRRLAVAAGQPKR